MAKVREDVFVLARSGERDPPIAFIMGSIHRPVSMEVGVAVRTHRGRSGTGVPKPTYATYVWR